MFYRKSHIIMLVMIFLFPIMAHAKKTYGLYENVQLADWGGVPVKSKLDTGAMTSSLNAVNIELFERDGKDWVRFQPEIEGDVLAAVDKEVVRYSHIKSRTNSNDEDPADLKASDRRPVVIIDVCFDGRVYPLEVNLTNRSHFAYPFLIGSSSLIKMKAVVDPSLKFQATQKCE